MSSPAAVPNVRSDWDRAPWTIKGMAVLTVVGHVGNGLIGGFEAMMIGSLLIAALLVYGLIRGSHTAWVVSLLFTLLSIVALWNVYLTRVMVDHTAASLFLDVPIVILNFILLFHPLTRRWLRHASRPE